MVPIADPVTLVAKKDDSIEYDFSHYEDPTLGYKSSNKSYLLEEVIIRSWSDNSQIVNNYCFHTVYTD